MDKFIAAQRQFKFKGKPAPLNATNSIRVLFTAYIILLYQQCV